MVLGCGVLDSTFYEMLGFYSQLRKENYNVFAFGPALSAMKRAMPGLKAIHRRQLFYTEFVDGQYICTGKFNIKILIGYT